MGLVFANQAAAEFSGFLTVEEFLSAPPAERLARYELFAEDGSPFPLEDLPGRRAVLGEYPDEVILRFRIKATGEERWSAVVARPVKDDSGRVLYAVSAFRDVTGQKMAEEERELALEREIEARAVAERARERMEFLALAGKTLFSSLDYTATLNRIAELAVPRVADWCALDLLHGDELRRLSVHHSDPTKVALAEELRVRYPPDPDERLGPYPVALTGESLLIPRLTAEMIREAIDDDEYATIIEGLGILSIMVVPLRSSNGILGTLTMVSAESALIYDKNDLEFAEELGLRAGTAMSHAIEFQQRNQTARALEQDLLPPELPTIEGLEVASRFLPAGLHNAVGGDFYDLFEVEPGELWALAIGDVRGKGPQAAALTGLVRHTMRNEARHDPCPEKIMEAVNVALLGAKREQFCALCYALVRVADGRCEIEGQVAGLPLPILRSGGEVGYVGEPGLLLGVLDEPDGAPFKVSLEAGESLVLFTDGVTDARRDGDVFGGARARQVIADAPNDAEGIASALVSEIASFGGDARHDDVAMIVIHHLA